MKRGAIVISQELLKEILKDRIPEDFKLSGIQFIPETNIIGFHGYSEEFHETLEGNMRLNESSDGWIPVPLKDKYAPVSRENTTYKGYGTVRSVGKNLPWWRFW